MKLWHVAAFVGFLSSPALASPVSSHTHVVHEKRNAAPNGWINAGRVKHDSLHLVKIGLRQSNLEQGQLLLEDITDPNSPHFGQHWSPEEVIAHFAPAQTTVDTVTAWLVGSGIEKSRISHSHNRAWLAFHATNAEAERLLNTEFHWFKHPFAARDVAASEHYHVPRQVSEHVDYVTPGILLTAAAPRSHSGPFSAHSGPHKGSVVPAVEIDIALKGSSELGNCAQLMTPPCLAALYNFTLLDSSTKIYQVNNSLGFFEGEGDVYAQEDLDQYFKSLLPNVTPGTEPQTHNIDGADAPGSVEYAGPESDLDLQLGYAVAYPQVMTVYQVDAIGDLGEDAGVFNTFLDAIDGSYCTLSAFGETGDNPAYDPTYPSHNVNGYNGTLQCGTLQPTNILSISYGSQEAYLPSNYQQRQCLEFMKLGLQGVSVFVASGDYGVGAGSYEGNGCLGPSSTVFNPTHPNTCPWVMNVGGTQLFPGQNIETRESAAYTTLPGRPVLSSSGGFSNIYGIPKYQKDAVAAYFKNHNPKYPYYSKPGNISQGAAGFGRYNRTGRGFPDLSANWGPHAIINAGEQVTEYGTSASAPIVAGLFARLNEVRVAMGKSTLGFILPTLYQHPEVFNDITNGTNPGCGTNGFSAVPGWDPVTGLGTPNFAKLLELVKSLP